MSTIGWGDMKAIWTLELMLWLGFRGQFMFPTAGFTGLSSRDNAWFPTKWGASSLQPQTSPNAQCSAPCASQPPLDVAQARSNYFRPKDMESELRLNGTSFVIVTSFHVIETRRIRACLDNIQRWLLTSFCRRDEISFPWS